MNKTGDNGEEWKFLAGVSSDIEAEIIESLLKEEGIPVIKKYREAGGFLQIYMGMTSFGIELYVPSSRLEGAKNLIKEEQ